MTTEMDGKINYDTSYEWLDRHYADTPEIWEEYDQEDACEALVDAVLENNLDSYDDVPASTLTRIMEDSRM